VNWYYKFVNLLHRPMVKSGKDDPYNQVYPQFLEIVRGLDAPVVLELGSRNVTGITRKDQFKSAGKYIGMDIHPGECVDVVGDAHKLSEYFAPNSIDVIFSASVFEHLLFPWKVVLEINKILKPGGYVFVSTHPSWLPHELPWDFWRFPVGGLSNLFIPETGFEVISAAEGQPSKAYSLVRDAPTRHIYKYHTNLAVGLIARKTSDYDTSRFRWDADSSVVKTQYPLPPQRV